MYELKTKLHLDELKAYALRDPAKLKPGTRVLFGRISPLTNPENEYNPQYPGAELGTVVEVAEKSPAELYPNAPRYSGDDKLSIFVLYRTDQSEVLDPHKIRSSYASDCGLIPYSGNYYNPDNFIVDLDGLEAQGFGIDFEVSEGYAEKLKRFNEQIERFGSYDYIDAY